MDISISGALAALQKGVEFVNQFSPIAKALGGTALTDALNLTSTVISIGEDLQHRIEQREVVASSQDAEFIKSALAQITTEAAQLAAEVDKS